MKGNSNYPNPDEIRKEVSEFLKNKYGDQVHIPPEPDKTGNEPGEQSESTHIPPQIQFDLKPSELEAYLKNFVVGQDETVEVLATKICTHFNRMKLEATHQLEDVVGNIKSNVLMIGPTGVGKTYLIKLIADKLGVPFVKGDATKFSETGYVGGDVEDLVRSLVHEADGDIKLAEYGIIYLDEIDKIASSGSSVGPDVSRTGVQRNLLKLMEESEVDLKTPHDLASQMEAAMEAQRTGKVHRKKVNTKNILFVMSGAFSGLSDIINRRRNQQPVGFRTSEDTDTGPSLPQDDLEVVKYVRTEDFIKYGFESEFIGRLPIVVILNDLGEDGLYQILNSTKSAVIQGKKRDFSAYHIDIDFTDEAYRRIAELAYQEKTGARGLVRVVDKALLKFEKSLPDADLRKFTVTREIIDDPETELYKILTHNAIKTFQKKFLATNGIVITFTPEAIQLIRERAGEEGIGFGEYCNNMLRDYEYGLRLLDCDEFTVDADIVREPKRRLEELIKKSYDQQH
jgi:endopeptidase Clp ATP-binding regulatory subunit ClpX